VHHAACDGSHDFWNRPWAGAFSFFDGIFVHLALCRYGSGGMVGYACRAMENPNPGYAGHIRREPRALASSMVSYHGGLDRYRRGMGAVPCRCRHLAVTTAAYVSDLRSHFPQCIEFRARRARRFGSFHCCCSRSFRSPFRNSAGRGYHSAGIRSCESGFGTHALCFIQIIKQMAITGTVMIPRTKVNYSFSQILRSLFIRNGGNTCRARLILGLSEFLGIKHIILTPSGRSALYILLRALPQKRVVVPAYTCKAVVESALLARKEVEYVEVNPQDFNMDLSLLESVIDSSTIVIATHQFGIPCDIRNICEISSKRGAIVIEDVAAAFGTKVGGRLVGTFATSSFYSFDSTKLINVPLKSGFLATNDSDLYERASEIARETLRPMSTLRRFSLLAQAFVLLAVENPLFYRCFHKLHFEWRGRFTADSPELNIELTDFYMNEMAEWQAYLACIQLESLDLVIKKRQKVYAELYAGLQDCPSIELPPPDQHQEWSCIRFPIRVRGDKMAFYREATRKGLDFAFSFTYIAAPEHMRKSHSIADAVLDLPFYSKLTDKELAKTISIVRSIVI